MKAPIKLCATLVLMSGSALANDRTVTLDIPPQALGSAFETFARQADVQFFYAADTVRGKDTAGLVGTFTPREAVEKLLADSGLTHTFTAEDAVAIQSAQNDPPPSPPTAGPKQPAEEAPVLLPPITVTASPYDDTSYNALDATTATKTDTPIMETPVSVQVVPQQVLRDQQAIRLEDAVKNVSGVQRDWGYGDLQQRFIIRGFPTDGGYFRNGIRLGNSESPAESANLERVEVLKGPAGMLYGRIEPGGLINAVTKRPLLETYYSLQQQFSSFDLYRTTVDATGPLTADRSLAYRFNLAYQDSESFRDFLFDEHVFVAPALSWRPTEATEFNLELEYYDGDQRHDSAGIPAIGNKPAPIPISRWLGEPDSKGIDQSNLSVDFNWSHRFNEAWALRNGVVTNLYDRDQENVVTTGLRADNRTLDRAIPLAHFETDNYTVYLDLTGNSHFWEMDHTLPVGGDYYSLDSENVRLFTTDPAVIGPIDIFDPVYGNVNFPLARSLRTNAPNGFDTFGDEWFGIYFQDQITLWDKLHILGGGRYDWASTSSGSSSASLKEAHSLRDKNEIDDEKFSPRVGLLYQPWPWLSLYGNYAQSLGANNGRSATGEPFEPQESEQYEAGLKTEWLDGRLTSTLAFYHLTKTNLLSADLSTVDLFDSIAIGEARSRGIEFDLAGQITDRVSLIATYAYTGARITKDQGQDALGNPIRANEGNRLANVPEHSGTLWAKFWLLPEQLEMGTGVYLVGDRQGDNENTLDLPGYGRLDLFAAYHHKLGGSRLTAQINVNNVLDKEYYKTTNTVDGVPRVRILPGEPLTVLGSIRIEF